MFSRPHFWCDRFRGNRFNRTCNEEFLSDRIDKGSRPASAEQRLTELGIKLMAPPEPFGTYVEAVQSGNLLFLTGMLPTEGHGDFRDQPKIADAASELLQDVFGKEKNPCRLVYGVASLPLGTPVELEVIFEVTA
jgi:enamine deaminase RidA (YjgF/YER057c/UK114 family)